MLPEAIMRNREKNIFNFLCSNSAFPIIFAYFAAANDDESLVTYVINRS
jgi:hypothetical protein